MGRESTVNQFAKADLLEQCMIVQWFDFSVLFIEPAVKHKTATDLVLQVSWLFIHAIPNFQGFEMCVFSIAQELNEHLAQRSYLVEQKLTLADVVVFYSMVAIMESLHPADKEKYLNVSRWYDHLQKNGEIRQNLPIINLSTIYLHGWATGTHM